MGRRHLSILFIIAALGLAATADTTPLSESERQIEECRSTMTAILNEFAAAPESRSSLDRLLNGKPFRILTGIHADGPASPEHTLTGNLKPAEQEDREGLSHIRQYYLALNDLTRHFIHDMQPVLRRAFFDSLKKGKVSIELPGDIPEPMTELEEFETLEQVLKLPPVKLRPILIALGIDPNPFFELDDDTRFMEFAIAADQKIQLQLCALLPSVFPWRTFEYTDAGGQTAFGVLALFCPSLKLPAIDHLQQNNDFTLPPETCREWLLPPLTAQEGIRPVLDSNGECHLLGIGRVILPSPVMRSADVPETRLERLTALQKREAAIDEARRRAISALQIHLAMTRFFTSEDSIKTLLENYRLTGFGNYSFENSLEASFKTLPQRLAAQTPLPASSFKMLLQLEERTDDGSQTVIVIMGL